MDQPTPAQPRCKTFNKRKAITCYKLRWNPKDFMIEHHELYRISNETPGEYYVLPIDTLQKQTNRHLSYHRSGAFHWRQENGSRIKPRDGEADERRASLLSQAIAHLSGRLHGYCVSRGRNVPDDSIDTMIEIMDGYIIPPLKLIGVNVALKQRKSYSILMMDSPYATQAQKIMSEAERNGDRSVISREQLMNLMSTQAPDAKCLILDPQPESFIVYPPEVMHQLMRIGQEMVMEKMKDKPSGFWTGSRALNLADPTTNI